MSIYGSVTLEDVYIDFNIDDTNKCTYTVHDAYLKESETLVADGRAFMNALSIAVHWDGVPTKLDYPAAEKLQGKIRWIP